MIGRITGGILTPATIAISFYISQCIKLDANTSSNVIGTLSAVSYHQLRLVRNTSRTAVVTRRVCGLEDLVLSNLHLGEGGRTIGEVRCERVERGSTGQIHSEIYNKGETRNVVRYGIILADFGSTRRFVDLLRWTQ